MSRNIPSSSSEEFLCRRLSPNLPLFPILLVYLISISDYLLISVLLSHFSDQSVPAPTTDRVYYISHFVLMSGTHHYFIYVNRPEGINRTFHNNNIKKFRIDYVSLFTSTRSFDPCIINIPKNFQIDSKKMHF